MDKFTPKLRSQIMSRVKGKDTRPELAVRKILYGLGYRYRLHVGDLPGKPDIVFRNRKKAIFVNGCFWHGHEDELCKKAKRPSSRREFWDKKLDTNKARDMANQALLEELGYDVLVLWECELKNSGVVGSRLRDFLADSSPPRIDVCIK